MLLPCRRVRGWIGDAPARVPPFGSLTAATCPVLSALATNVGRGISGEAEEDVGADQKEEAWARDSNNSAPLDSRTSLLLSRWQPSAPESR